MYVCGRLNVNGFKQVGAANGVRPLTAPVKRGFQDNSETMTDHRRHLEGEEERRLATQKVSDACFGQEGVGFGACGCGASFCDHVTIAMSGAQL